MLHIEALVVLYGLIRGFSKVDPVSGCKSTRRTFSFCLMAHRYHKHERAPASLWHMMPCLSTGKTNNVPPAQCLSTTTNHIPSRDQWTTDDRWASSALLGNQSPTLETEWRDIECGFREAWHNVESVNIRCSDLMSCSLNAQYNHIMPNHLIFISFLFLCSDTRNKFMKILTFHIRFMSVASNSNRAALFMSVILWRNTGSGSRTESN